MNKLVKFVSNNFKKGIMYKSCTKVTLRQRPISKGMFSLYLDYYPAFRNPYTLKMQRREYLGIYIYAKPKNKIEREYNEEMLEKSEVIRCRRSVALINNDLDCFNKFHLKEDFLAYYKKICWKKDQKWDIVYEHFYDFCGGTCTFGDINQSFCNKFKEYLLSKANKNGTFHTISQNSAASYWSTFRALLKIAYHSKMIDENINDFLEKIDTEDVHKEYLTLEELKKLARTPCKIDVLKRASLFSCLTGLRISDVMNLKWENIEKGSEGGYCMRITTIKTKSVATLPISDEAFELCGQQKAIGTVFKGMKRCFCQVPLQNWLKDAGITKHITFHCFRHTFATLQIAEGTDIYTVSKMLTHRNVSTTQIYADLVDEKKRESANKISLK